MRTVRVVDGQDVSVIADARHPWNGRFTVEGSSAVLLLRLLIIRGQSNEMGGAVLNRGGQVRCAYKHAVAGTAWHFAESIRASARQ